MYLSFFGLNEKPFAITPDPRYLFLSGLHAEALAHLVYGIKEAGGFIQLTGEVGTGKTTIIRSLLTQVPKNTEIALILNPRVNAPEFLLTICEELGIGVPNSSIGSVKELVDILNDYLLKAHAAGRRVVVVIDEAQNLAPEVLEQVRLLTNLETETQKLLQIILIGQPELRELLDRNDLRQLAQRITARYHLEPLSREESHAYVRHRLRVAGATSELFASSALDELYRVSGGIPRLINIVADRALLGAFSQDRHEVGAPVVRSAAGEVFNRRLTPPWFGWAAAACGAAVLALGGIVAWQSLRPSGASTTPVTSAAPAVAAPASGPAMPAAVTISGAGVTVSGADGAAPVAVGATAGASGVVGLDALLDRSLDETDADNAFNRLFALWGARYVLGRVDACTQAVEQGLECFGERGTLAQLRLYNRPAILQLTDAKGRSHQVVLANLDDEHATLSLGGAPQRVGIADLSRYWFGDYVLLWRPGTREVKPLSVGMRGADVRRLRESLERLRDPRTPPPAPPRDGSVFDSGLQQLVAEFQRAHQITADGVAGVQTLVLLDAALAGPGTPLLVANTRVAQGG